MSLLSRARLVYLSLTLVTIALGLGSRRQELPEFIHLYVGDVLWALMVFWCCRLVSPNSKCYQSAGYALSFVFCIEFSQFYQADWLNHIRATKLGGLVLGFGFKFSDLICYLIGVALGYVLNSRYIKHLIKK